MFVQERFELPSGLRQHLKSLPVKMGFNGLGEASFYRSYSRPIRDAAGNTIGQEDWADVIARVIEGTISIHKDTTIRRQGLKWDEGYWSELAWPMAEMAHALKWGPPGRGYWMNGTDYMYQRGSAALMNCAFVDVRGQHRLSHDMGWLTDMLMLGVGVGFSAQTRGDLRLARPSGKALIWQIPDTREGWAESVERLIRSYEEGSSPVAFDYSLLRPFGAPIEGFGGVASGPEPLMLLHDRIVSFCERYLAQQEGRDPEYTETRLIADLGNAIGACVVAGNVRRSAEIMLGNLDDPQFIDLKNVERFPERAPWMHLSNNSVRLYQDDDFARLPEIASRIQRNGEPGFLNMINIAKYGRFGDEVGAEVIPGVVLKRDLATGANPCSEIPLESYETCCLSEVFLPNCQNDEEIRQAIEFATIYATVVQWMPTHRPETNAVNTRNRRIGVSLSGIFDWYEREGMSRLVRTLRDGYKQVRAVNARLAREVGFHPGIRVTTVKPSGTISKMAGVSSGIHAPEYGYYIRRIRIARDWTGRSVLDAAGIPSEPDVTDPEGTVIYEFPLAPAHDWPVRTVNDVSMWEQLMLLMAVQRHWADNMVSMTVKYKPEEEGQHLERAMAMMAGNIKSASFMAIFDPETKVLIDGSGTETVLYTREAVADAEALCREYPAYRIVKKVVYPQLPEEPITQEEFQARVAAIRPFDWSGFVSNDEGTGEKYCGADGCEIDLSAIREAARQAREAAAGVSDDLVQMPELVAAQ